MTQDQLYDQTWNRYYRQRHDEELFSRPYQSYDVTVARARAYADRMSRWTTPAASVMAPSTAAFHLVLIFATCGLWAPVTLVHLILGSGRYLTGRRPR